MTLSSTVLRLSKATPKLKCRQCGEFESLVVRPISDVAGEVYARIRECLWCGYRYYTEERVSERRLKQRGARRV